MITLNDQPIELDHALRPKFFAHYVGQPQLIQRLRIALGASLNRGEPMEHVLLHGPPGLGKTTLANIIANEAGTAVHYVTAPALGEVNDLLQILRRLSVRDVLFIDEIHRLDPIVEEQLYPVMEDFKVDVGTSQGPRTVNLPPFTLVGATTRQGDLTGALRSRFGIVAHLDFYEPADLATILTVNTSKLGMHAPREALHLLAERARGTPRIANNLLRRLRDFADFERAGDCSVETAQAMLKMEGIDSAGLNEQDRHLLRVLIETYGGGPAGVKAIAASMGEEPNTIEDAVEPYLIRCGYLTRTPRGRRVTDKAINHLTRSGQ